MERVVTSYDRSARDLKHYMANLRVNTPPPLAATANRPDRVEAIRNYVSRYDRSELVH